MLRLVLSATLFYMYSQISNGFKVKYCTQNVMLKATIMSATLAEDTDEEKTIATWASTRKLELEKNKDAEPENKKLRIGLWM